MTEDSHHCQCEKIVLSEEAIKQFLKNFGLTQAEAEVYLFLTKHSGASKGTDIAKITKKDKGQIYRTLKSLQSKGLIESTLEAPVRFAPVPFESIVESVIKAKREEASRIENAKQELFDYWKKLGKTKIDEPLEKFSVIEGTNKIYAKITQMIGQTKEQFSTITTVRGLLQAYQLGVFDEINNHPSKSNIEFRYLTEISNDNINSVKSLLAPMSILGLNIKGRNPNVGLKLSPQMVIKDHEEALFFMSSSTDQNPNQDDVCLWTNSGALVQAFVAVFEDLWNNSSEITKKIAELETGVPTPKNLTFKTIESAHGKFNELIASAKKEIVILTSADRLSQLSKNQSFIKVAKKGISIQVMAPISRGNFQKDDPLFSLFKVRHIPANFYETTIVDGKYLLQINCDGSKSSNNVSAPCFTSAFYSEETEHVREMKATLNDIWKHAQPLFSDTLETTVLFGSPTLPFPENNLFTKCNRGIFEVKPPGVLTEKDVVSKIINAKKLIVQNQAVDISKMYASVGVALIHPPDVFKLPGLVILAFHVDKNSSFGAEDYIVVYQQLKPNGIYVPVSIAGENPTAKEILKEVYKGTPAGSNYTLLKKDEIEIRIHGNTLFAAWVVPIPIYPTNLTLPPGCMQIEGYGPVKTVGYSSVGPSGFKHEVEQNYFDSFVTFFHPASKYSGPGTDAIFCRDYISTNYPPKQSGST